jgi:PAS domain S-box-containing protein
MLLEGLPRIAEHLRQFCLSCCGNCPFPPEVSVRRLLGETSEAMLVLDTSGAIAFANPALCALSGVSVESLHNQPVETLLTGRSASRLRSAVKQGGLPTPLPLTLIRHNGREIDMSGQVHPVLDGTGSACGHVVLLAEEVESERRTKPSRSPWEKVRRVMATESACNRALVRAQSEEDLYAAICRAVVEEGGYRMAWVGLAERSQERAVRPVAQAGFEKGYLKTIRVTWADNEHGRGPVGTAIRTGQPAIVNNIEINPAFAPWRRQARERGYTSCVALPLKTGLHVLGTLAIYATEEDAFDADAMALLTRLANTLAYGVTAMRIRQENEQVKQDLEETARQLERRNAERHAKLDNLQRDLARETSSASRPRPRWPGTRPRWRSCRSCWTGLAWC